MFEYIINVILFQLLFLLVYETLLKKETFFLYNRLYLLLTPIIAFVLPLLKIEALGQAVTETYTMLPTVYLTKGVEDLAMQHSNLQEISPYKYLWWLYAVGAVISGILFAIKYSKLRKLFKYKSISRIGAIDIVEVPNSDIACTFLSKIFIGDQITEEEREQILSHEVIHAEQKHSIDLLFFEVQKILFWFNPFIYIFQSHISLLHEFIADEGAVKSSGKQSYYQQLLNTAFNTRNISFINQFFNHSLIKKRIVMLQKSKSSSVSKFKYLFLVPLMLVMLTYISCAEDAGKEVEPMPQTETYGKVLKMKVEDVHNLSDAEENKRNEYLNSLGADGQPSTLIITDGENSKSINVGDAKNAIPPPAPQGPDTNGNVPFALVETAPVFPGCEGKSEKELKKCVSDKIQQHVQENFNMDKGQTLGLPGINRIIVQFKIDKNGEITDVKGRASHPELEKEGIRVIQSLPKMKPGLFDGKPVNVMYSLPIVYQVQ